MVKLLVAGVPEAAQPRTVSVMSVSKNKGPARGPQGNKKDKRQTLGLLCGVAGECFHRLPTVPADATFVAANSWVSVLVLKVFVRPDKPEVGSEMFAHPLRNDQLRQTHNIFMLIQGGRPLHQYSAS